MADSRPIGQLSEAELLASFLPIIDQHNKRVLAKGRQHKPSMQLGPGDDCALLDLTEASTAVTIDSLTENQDFRQVWPCGQVTRGYDLGWKLASQNLADLAAMGAQPVSLLVSLGLPAEQPLDWLCDFAQGLVDSCWQQGATSCTVSGGDLGKSREISATATALGRVLGRPITRSAARDKDILAFNGHLGLAAAGLALLEQPKEPDKNQSVLTRAIEQQLRPQAAILAGQTAGSCAHAMLDISDGLLRDADRLAQASGLTISIESSRLAAALELLKPVARWLLPEAGAEELEQECLTWALTGGEDHAMLACFAPAELAEGFWPLGVCHKTEASAGVLLDGLQPRQLGWDHFAR